MREITLAEVRQMAREAEGQIDRIFLHWSAGHYRQPFADYHLNIADDGAIITDVVSFAEVLAHTWRQNSGAIGVALLCGYQATPGDLGPEPPTPEQIEQAARVVAVLCEGLGLECTVDFVRTHAEQADRDGYGPATTCERWDLAILANEHEWMSGGDTLRGKAIWYLTEGRSELT